MTNTKNILVVVGIVLFVSILAIYGSRDEVVYDRRVYFKNQVEANELWHYNVGSAIQRVAIFDDHYYLIDAANHMTILSKSGEIIDTFPVQSEFLSVADTLYVDEDYIMVEDFDVAVFIDKKTNQIVNEFKVDVAPSTMSLLNGVFVYDDPMKLSVYAIDVKTGNLLWEFTNDNEKPRKYTAFVSKNKLFINNLTNKLTYEVDVMSSNILKAYENILVHKVVDDNDNYYIWEMEGLGDPVIQAERHQLIGQTLYNLPNGNWFKVTRYSIKLFDSHFNKISETDLLYEARSERIYNDMILIFNNKMPIQLFSPEEERLVWVDDYSGSPTSLEVYRDVVIIGFDDGFIKCIGGFD